MIEHHSDTPVMRTRAENYFIFECHRFFHGNGEQCLAPGQCHRRHRKVLMWRDGYANDMTTAGLNKYLDATLKTGLTSPAWYVGLVDNAAFSAFALADIMSSHAGWAESVAYSDSTRQAFTPGSVSAGSVSNSAAKAVFNINATATIKGGFLVDVSTKSGTTGTLFGEGAFASTRAVVNGDVLSVQATATLTGV